MEKRMIRMRLDGDDDVIAMPEGAQILSADAQGEGIAIIAMVPKGELATRAHRFVVVRGYSDEGFDGKGLVYIATVGVAHVFEAPV
jgi:hypothetical protein